MNYNVPQIKNFSQQNCPIHPEYELIFLNLDTKQKNHLQCAYCIAYSNSRHLISLQELIQSNHNTIIKYWPIKDDQDIYDKLIEISSCTNYTQEIQTKVQNYFQQLRSLIEKELTEKEEQMMKQSETLTNIIQNVILQYNKLAVKEELKDIILNKTDDFQKQNMLLRESISKVIYNQERNKQQLLDALNELKSQEDLINFDIPNMIKDNITQLIEKIGIIDYTDFQSISHKDNLDFDQNKINKKKSSEMTTNQQTVKLMNNEVNHCSKQLTDCFQYTQLKDQSNNQNSFCKIEQTNNMYLFRGENYQRSYDQQNNLCSQIKENNEFSDLINYDEHQNSKFLKYKHIQDKNCIISKQLDFGRIADYFEGQYVDSQGIKKDCVFKIQSSLYQELYDNEVDILKSFANGVNIVGLIDSINNEKYNYNVIVLEKCQISLKDELTKIKKESFPFNSNMLFKMIFDCLDGLVYLETNETTHFSIKPSNILKNEEGIYCISGFGFSHKRTIENYQFKYKGNSSKYTPWEQIQKPNKGSHLGFHCDIYSMGRILLEILETFLFVNKNSSNQLKKEIEIFKDIINNSMILDDYDERKNSLEIHDLFLKNSREYKELLKYYLQQVDIILNHIQNRINSVPREQKLIFKYIQLFKIHYLKIKLWLIEDDLTQKFAIMNYQNEISVCYEDIEDYENALEYVLKLIEMTKQNLNSGFSEIDLQKKAERLERFDLINQ